MLSYFQFCNFRPGWLSLIVLLVFGNLMLIAIAIFPPPQFPSFPFSRFPFSVLRSPQPPSNSFPPALLCVCPVNVHLTFGEMRIRANDSDLWQICRAICVDLHECQSQVATQGCHMWMWVQSRDRARDRHRDRDWYITEVGVLC